MPPVFRSLAVSLLLFFLFPFMGPGQTLPPEISVFSQEAFQGHPQIHCGSPLGSRRMAFGSNFRVLIHYGEGIDYVDIGEGKAVFSMDLASNGLLYLGGRSLIGRIVPDSLGRLRYRSLKEQLPDSLQDLGIIWDTWCDPKGGVYFNAEERLFLYREDSMHVIRPEEKFYSLHTPDGRPVIHERKKGFYRIEGKRTQHLEGSKAFAGAAVRAVLPAPNDERDWTVVTKSKGLFHFDPGSGSVDAFWDGDAELLVGQPHVAGVEA
ncbi:MAG: hypothetical protein ABEH38_07320, partial [Flavobacteriales bacterium]